MCETSYLSDSVVSSFGTVVTSVGGLSQAGRAGIIGLLVIGAFLFMVAKGAENNKNVARVYNVGMYICVLLAIVTGLSFREATAPSSPLDSIPKGELTWVKCNNPACKSEYEMSKRTYYEKIIEERFNPLAYLQASTCEKCGMDSLYKAEKCANPDCGVVFISGSVPNDFADRCPECKYSQTETDKQKGRSEEIN